MKKLMTPKRFAINLLPEVVRTQEVNPGNKLDEVQIAIMYGRAIHWLSFLDILCPPFEDVDCYFVETKYLVRNDPDYNELPVEFYRQVAEMLSMFWTLRLSNLYPEGNWKVEISENEDMLVQANIYSRGE